MVTLYDFMDMNDQGRAELTWTGTYLGERHEREYIIQLYSLPDFYVEVFYNPVTNQISLFRGFKKLSQLAPYMETFAK